MGKSIRSTLGALALVGAEFGAVAQAQGQQRASVQSSKLAFSPSTSPVSLRPRLRDKSAPARGAQ
jgi:hypothetical protein